MAHFAFAVILMDFASVYHSFMILIHDHKHYVELNWPPRTSYQPGLCSVNNIPLVHPGNVPLLPLHIKFVLMKRFIKTLGRRNSRGFEYIVEKFPKITKLKEGIFLGPQT